MLFTISNLGLPNLGLLHDKDLGYIKDNSLEDLVYRT